MEVKLVDVIGGEDIVVVWLEVEKGVVKDFLIIIWNVNENIEELLFVVCLL